MMKNLKNFMLFVMMVSTISLTTSCSSDDDSGSGAGVIPSGSGTMAATIDGNSFQSEPLTSTAVKVTSEVMTTLTLRAGDFAGNTIVITINGYEGPDNTYLIDSDNLLLSNATYTVVDATDIFNPVTTSWVAPYMDSGVAGSVTIETDDDNTVTGIFQFTARIQEENGNDTIDVTNGSFNLTLSQF